MSNNEIPVGSRWRIHGMEVTVMPHVYAAGKVRVLFPDGMTGIFYPVEFSNATRIDAPPAVKVVEAMLTDETQRGGRR